jgi:hypothetical protein
MATGRRGRRARKSASRKRGGNNTITIQRSIVLGITKITTDSGDYNELSLGGFPGSSDLSSTFQQYRIIKARVTYKLVTAPNSANAAFPTLYTAPQYLQSGLPGSRDEVLQYQGMKVFQFAPSRTEVTYTYVPKVNRVVYRSAIASSYEPCSAWLSTLDLNAQHYYSAEWIDRYNTTTNNEHTIEKVVTVWVQCKLSR